jgi:hypothetical protein
MYEDEKKCWQNRLEKVWVEIDEVAKHADSVFIALVNKVAGQLDKAFGRLFGVERVSARFLAVSITLSFVAWHGIGLYEFYRIPSHLRIGFTDPGDMSGLKEYLCLFVIVIIFSERIVDFACLGYMAGEAFSLVIAMRIQDNHAVLYKAFATMVYLATFVSLTTDIVAVMLIRKVFRCLAQTTSIKDVIRGFFVLFILGVGTCLTPFVITQCLGDFHSYFPLSPSNFIRAASSWLLTVSWKMNATTLIYAMLPAFLFVVLLVHKILWPFCARLTYALLEFRILQDRKFLIPMGTAAYGIAFGITKNRVPDLLGLFKYLR